MPARSPTRRARLVSGVNHVIELSIDDAGLLRCERALTLLYRDQLPFAMSRALNDCARAATQTVNRGMATTFDRPTKFTERAAVAPRELAATKTSLVATVTLHPIQAQYLQLEETGGTRTGAMNTGKASKTVLLPGATLPLNEFVNIPRGTLAKLNAMARKATKKAKRKAAVASAPGVFFMPSSAPGNKAGVAGWFRRLPNHGLARLTAFEKSTNYHARMGYHLIVEASVRLQWPHSMAARLHEAISTAR